MPLGPQVIYIENSIWDVASINSLAVNKDEATGGRVRTLETKGHAKNLPDRSAHKGFPGGGGDN